VSGCQLSREHPAEEVLCWDNTFGQKETAMRERTAVIKGQTNTVSAVVELRTRITALEARGDVNTAQN
jgi:hypothetical protein